MATTKNITMKQFNGTDYDTLYPKTVYSQVSGVAPDGYGLGVSSATLAQDSDANNIYKNGWYKAGINVPKNGYWYILYISYESDYATQIAFGIKNTSGILDGTVCKRYKVKDTWSAWEYVNPPMDLNVEYRTTERYQGKPVYVRLINCGNMPSAGGSKAVQAPYDGANNPITNAWIVHSHLSYYNQTLPMYGYGNTVTVKAAAGVNSSGSITIYASEDTDLTNSSAILYVVLKYTKSTD